MPELQIAVEEGADDDCQPPSYKTPGRILVRYLGPNGGRVYRHELEVLDYDADSSVFWISEGVGFDHWLDDCDFPEPGVYVVEGITGEYIRGDGWHTDDYEEWDFKGIRPATEAEQGSEALDDLQNSTPSK